MRSLDTISALASGKQSKGEYAQVGWDHNYGEGSLEIEDTFEVGEQLDKRLWHRSGRLKFDNEFVAIHPPAIM